MGLILVVRPPFSSMGSGQVFIYLITGGVPASSPTPQLIQVSIRLDLVDVPADEDHGAQDSLFRRGYWFTCG